jgi:hypothetical protein
MKTPDITPTLQTETHGRPETPKNLMSKVCPWLTEAEFEERRLSLLEEVIQHSRQTGMPIPTSREGKPVLIYPDGQIEAIPVKP